jgi:phosphatidylglycerophosphate synthase
LTASAGLAYKAYEIEELVDVYFFRRLGYVLAHLARIARLTPNAVSVLAAIVGIAGGVLLYSPRTAFAGFLFLVVHGIADSADGQLARMTNQTSVLGRTLDGLSGWVTHVAMYVALLAGLLARGADSPVVWWAIAAGVSSAVHAQLYEYHRSAYARLVVAGRAEPFAQARSGQSWFTRLLRGYESMQARLAGKHSDVEARLIARSQNGVVSEADRAAYRTAFYGPTRGWNLLGDNMRRFAVGAAAWFGRLDLYFPFVVLPMNLALMILWIWQYRADRRFLAVH